jgi:hypothetical protein
VLGASSAQRLTGLAKRLADVLVVLACSALLTVELASELMVLASGAIGALRGPRHSL